MNTRSGNSYSGVMSAELDVESQLDERYPDSKLGKVKPELRGMLDEVNRLKESCVKVNEEGLLLAMKLLAEE